MDRPRLIRIGFTVKKPAFRLALLLLIAGALWAYATFTDYPAPAWGMSRLPGIAFFVVLLVLTSCIVVGLAKLIKRRFH